MTNLVCTRALTLLTWGVVGTGCLAQVEEHRAPTDLLSGAGGGEASPDAETKSPAGGDLSSDPQRTDRPALAEVSCADHSATTLFDGRVLVVGTCQFRGHPFAAAVVDWENQTLEVQQVEGARDGHCATALADGSVLVSGGVETGTDAIELGQPVANVERFTADGLEPVAPMAVPRAFHTCTTMPDGDVVATGGMTTHYGAPWLSITASVERFHPGFEVWTAAPSMLTVRHRHGAQLFDGDLIVAGGFGPEEPAESETRPYAGAERWDVNGPGWSPVAGGPQSNNSFAGDVDAGVLVSRPTGLVLLQGGQTFEAIADELVAVSTYRGFFAKAAVYVPQEDRLWMVGLGYYGGLDAAFADPILLLWKNTTIAQVSGSTSQAPNTLTRLSGGRVLMIGDTGSALLPSH